MSRHSLVSSLIPCLPSGHHLTLLPFYHLLLSSSRRTRLDNLQSVLHVTLHKIALQIISLSMPCMQTYSGPKSIPLLASSGTDVFSYSSICMTKRRSQDTQLYQVRRLCWMMEILTWSSLRPTAYWCLSLRPTRATRW